MRRLNIGELIWFIILCGFTIYISILLKDGSISKYIHPHMIKYTKFAAMVFGILAFLQIPKIFGEGNNFKVIIIIFFIPLVLGIIIYGKEEIGMANKEIYNINVEMSGHTHNEYNDEHSSKFLEVFNDLSKSMYTHENDIVELVGYVHRDSKDMENQFWISRVVMACCAADSQVISILCKDEGELKLKEQEWIRIVGKVKAYKDGSKIIQPVILERIDRPEQIYIYQ